MAKDEMPRQVKGKVCVVTRGDHVWSTFERIVNGAHTKLTLCKNCGMRP